MAIKLHVISQYDTGVVLAACTRGEGGTPADILSQLIGDAFPLTAPAVTQPDVPASIGSIDVSSLAVDVVPIEPSSTEAQDVLQNPTTYGVVRDLQHNFQKLQSVGSLNNLKLTTGGVTFTVVTNLPVGPPINAWIQLFDPNTNKTTTLPGLTFQPDMTDRTSGNIGFTVAAGTYNAIVLVQGYAASLQISVAVAEDTVTVP